MPQSIKLVPPTTSPQFIKHIIYTFPTKMNQLIIISNVLNFLLWIFFFAFNSCNPNWFVLWAKYSWREVCTVDVSTKQNKSLIQLNWSWVQKPPSFFHILPIRQSWLESSFVWLEQGGDYQWHLSSATYHRSGAVLAHIGPVEHYGDSWDLSHTILEKMAPGLGQHFQR